MKPELQAARWFDEGAKKHREFVRDSERLRHTMMDAAFFFISARELVPAGEWLIFLEARKDVVRPRTVRFWIAIAEDAMKWVLEFNPKLKKVSDIQAAAREVVIQSPKALIALWRELRFMRPFGEYDSVKYAAQKRLGNGQAQIEFDFEKLSSTVDVLAHLDKYELRFPEGMDEKEALTNFKTNLLLAVSQVDSQIKQWEAVPI